MTKADCLAAVAAGPNPELYFCLRYESSKTVPWAPEVTPQAMPPEPKPADPAASKPNDIQAKRYTRVAGLADSQ